MANLLLKIDDKFDNKSVLELFSFYHLGKEKIKQLKIYVNDELKDKNTILHQNDLLKLEYFDEIDFLPLDKKLKVLYEDEHLLIVDKPHGILVHPDAKDKNGTLVNIVSNYYHKTNQNISVKYLHRIDVDTSGIVVFGKDILTTSYLMEKISKHEFLRRYLCICSGKFEEDMGRYDYPIAENRYIANKKRVSPTGKTAITNYKVIKRMKKNLNLCLVELETGRTHQIRVHFSYKGHPLVGDGLYNGNTNLLKRQALHSYEVDFIHPITSKRIHIISELPSDMKELVKKYE